MLTDAELALMRATSRRALPAACTITRPATTFDLDETTGRLEDPEGSEVWSGPCRVRSLNTHGLPGVVGDLFETFGRYTATLPHDAVVQVDDYLTVTAGTDAGLIGRPMRVRDVAWSEWGIDRRVVVEDLEQPRVVE